MATERRENTRMLCSELVDVGWKERSGHRQRASANLEDISLSGVCLQVDHPIPLGTELRIDHPKGEFQGTVRYCLFLETGYFLGVEFAPGFKWSPEDYQPQHLLDLRTLVTRSAQRTIQEPGEEPAP